MYVHTYNLSAPRTNSFDFYLISYLVTLPVRVLTAYATTEKSMALRGQSQLASNHSLQGGKKKKKKPAPLCGVAPAILSIGPLIEGRRLNVGSRWKALSILFGTIASTSQRFFLLDGHLVAVLGARTGPGLLEDLLSSLPCLTAGYVKINHDEIDRLDRLYITMAGVSVGSFLPT